MPKKNDELPVRKPRADSERNRLLLLATAKAAFAEKGSMASLEEIARTAGVGIGTLYRHFPNRDELVAAVYLNETQQLARAASSLAGTQKPIDALREWMIVFIDYIAAKQGMYAALNSLAAGTADLYAKSGASIREAIGMLTTRAVEAGDIKLEIDPLELLRAIATVANTGAPSHGRDAAIALTDIIIAGITSKERLGASKEV